LSRIQKRERPFFRAISIKTLPLLEKGVKQLLTMDEVIEAVESASKADGLDHAQIPAKTYISYGKYKGALGDMPLHLEELDISAFKIDNSHPEKPHQVQSSYGYGGNHPSKSQERGDYGNNGRNLGY
jgi:ornithine cyclodeaminase/alanine dehydrogenase-like protein (mu-crystallin family)